MKLSELQTAFITNRIANGSTPETINTYQRRWRLTPFDPDTPIYDITPEQLDEWAASLNHLADATRRGYIQAVTAPLRFAVARGYLPTNPASSLDWPAVTHSAREKVMKRADLYRLLDTCDDTYTGISGELHGHSRSLKGRYLT